MGQHHDKGNAGADRGGKSRAVYAHIAGKDKNIIAKDVENAAGEHAERRKTGISIVAQKRREHLVEQKQREYHFNRPQVGNRQRQQLFVRAEEGQDRPIEAQNGDPRNRGERERTDYRRCPPRRASC